jgi:hypothetical protein
MLVSAREILYSSRCYLECENMRVIIQRFPNYIQRIVINILSTLLPFNAKYKPIYAVKTIKDLLTSSADSTHHFLPTTRRRLHCLGFQRLDPEVCLDRLCLKNCPPFSLPGKRKYKGRIPNTIITVGLNLPLHIQIRRISWSPTEDFSIL